jgi:hypothetical protein
VSHDVRVSNSSPCEIRNACHYQQDYADDQEKDMSTLVHAANLENIKVTMH